jgi:hypothetical protein
MTPLSPARRAAEEFARVVDGTTVDVADRYSDLTAYVDVLRAQDIPAPRADFVADLRMRLMDAADTLLLPADAKFAPVITLPQPGRRRERRIATAAAALVLVGGTAGVAAAAENALPGDALYPVKRAIESAQVSMNSSDTAKGHDLLNQAGTRLDEVDALMGHGDSTTQITHTLASYQRTATSGADLLFVAYQRGGDTGDLSEIRALFGSQSAQLEKLAGQAPPSAKSAFAAATALLADLDQQARVLCGNCGPDSLSSDSFVDMSSSSALESLLTQPVAAAAAEAEASRQQSLASKAGEIAAHTPATTSPGTTTITGALPSTPLPSLPTGTGTLTTTVTGGVKDLLSEVSAATGGATTPLTDTLSTTLDTITNLLQ